MLGLESACEVVGGHKVAEVRAQLIVAVMVEALNGGVLDRAVHALDLTVGPRMVGLGQPVLDAVGLANHVEAHRPGVYCVPVPWLLCELDPVASRE